MKSILIFVIGSLLVWGAQEHFKDAPSVTYIVSDAIEIVGSQGTEYAQEISVSNLGNKVAQGVSIKVPHHITSYKLTKHSELVKEQVVSEMNRFELVYPEIPSKQKLKLLIRYESNSLGRDWISVSHADGNAQSIDKQTSPINYLYLWLAFSLGNLIYFLLDIRKYKRDAFQKWGRHGDEFRDTKPWFATSAEWSEMQFETINAWLGQYKYTPSIQHTHSYILLNKSKPELLSQEHWVKLQNEAISNLQEAILKKINRYAKTGELADLLNLIKPEAFPLQKWTELQQSINEQIVTNLLPRHLSDSDLVELLKPDNLLLKDLPRPLVGTIREKAQRRYSSYLIENTLNRVLDPSRAVTTAHFDLLSTDQEKRIKSYLQKLERLDEMPTSWSLYELQGVISKGKPAWMKDDEFDSLCQFVSQSERLSKDRSTLRDKERDLASTISKAEGLKSRVLAQLEFIDKIISEPDSIDKIEDYDDTFAPGNRRNLELVANTLKTAKESA